jgi:hypothetical protein
VVHPFNNNNNLFINIGVSVVRGLLPRMLLLWRNSFPRSSKELESEKARGDAFTWQVRFKKTLLYNIYIIEDVILKLFTLF